MSKPKKLIIFIIFTIFVVLLSFSLIYGFGKYNIENSLNDYWYSDENKTINSSDIIRCNISFLKPNVAFVSDHILLDDIDELKIYFYGIKNIFSKKDDNREFIGVTTVKNTTFPELVKMIKEDCSQFQEGHGDYYGEDLAWSYSPYEPEPEKTQEEIEYEQKLKDLSAKVRQERIERGEIDDPTFESVEEGFRYSGVPEDEIKRILEEQGIEYVGPK